MADLCVTVAITAADDISGALDDATRAKDGGARIVEFRAESLAIEPLETGVKAARRLLRESPLPAIFTVRDPGEGGLADATDDERAALLAGVAAVAATGESVPRWVDIEYASWNRSPQIQAAVRTLREAGVSIVMSMHDFDDRPKHLYRTLAAMQASGECDVVKVAFFARSLRDAAAVFELLRERTMPMIAIAMGPFGVTTRMLAGVFGSLWTYCTLEQQDAVAPGQTDLSTLRSRYRAHELDSETDVYGIIGWPVEHSRSPIVHNAAFASLGLNAAYIPMPIAADPVSFKATLGTWLETEGLRFCGASVTVPHKENLVDFVRDRGGSLCTWTEMCGAANTLDVDRAGGGMVSCRNTDAPAIAELLKPYSTDMRVCIVGAGGVARAAAVAAGSGGHAVHIMNRTAARATALAGAIKDAVSGSVTSGEMNASAVQDCDIIINATSVGMAGGDAPDDIPLPRGVDLRADQIVFDTVYTPRETPLVLLARSAGATVITGDQLFARQAALQFFGWTGKPLPDVARVLA